MLAKQVNSTNSGNYFQRMGNSLGNEKKTVSDQKQEAKTREKLDNFGNVKAAGVEIHNTHQCASRLLFCKVHCFLLRNRNHIDCKLKPIQFVKKTDQTYLFKQNKYTRSWEGEFHPCPNLQLTHPPTKCERSFLGTF